MSRHVGDECLIFTCLAPGNQGFQLCDGTFVCLSLSEFFCRIFGFNSFSICGLEGAVHEMVKGKKRHNINAIYAFSHLNEQLSDSILYNNKVLGVFASLARLKTTLMKQLFPTKGASLTITPTNVSRL